MKQNAVMHANKLLHSGNPSVPFCFSLYQEVEATVAAQASQWLVALRAAQKVPGGSSGL